MVWAAEFVRAMADDVHTSVAARRAATAVIALRDPGTHMLARAGDAKGFPDDARAMLADMLGVRT